MVVVFAEYLPPAVRGRMKLWFVEPKPNVFVSGVNDAVAEHVVTYLLEHCPADAGVIVFQRIRKAPGYRILSHGPCSRKLTEISGLLLVQELSRVL